MIYAAVDLNCLFVGGVGRTAMEQPGAEELRGQEQGEPGDDQADTLTCWNIVKGLCLACWYLTILCSCMALTGICCKFLPVSYCIPRWVLFDESLSAGHEGNTFLHSRGGQGATTTVSQASPASPIRSRYVACPYPYHLVPVFITRPA